MKFSKLSQLLLVSSIGLLVATLFSACAITTIDFVYVACSAGSGTSSAGEIQTYAVDSQSGALRTGQPTVSSGGVNPISMAVTSDYANLYVANASAGHNSIVHFAIGLNGVLTAKDTLNITGTPVSIAVNEANTYLYVVSGPSPAVLAAYPLTSGTIGTAASVKTLSLYGTYATYSGDVLVPTGISVLANNAAVYVTAYDQSAYNPGCLSCITSTANPGWVFGYTVGAGGILTAIANPIEAGVKPTAIAADPTNRFAYVTDYAQGQLIGYSIMSSSTLNPMPTGPFRAGDEPSAIVIDPRGKFIYVTNSLDSTVSPYEIDLATGSPSVTVNATSTGGSNATDTMPVAIAIEPALGRFVYTANFLGNSVSGFRLDSTSGALSLTQSTPYPTGSKPTALIGIPHGNYSTQAVNP